MTGESYNVTLGDRGRLVLPMELRQRLHLEAGDPLILIETHAGVVLATREQALDLLRASLRPGPSLVEQLLADRRAEAARDAS